MTDPTPDAYGRTKCKFCGGMFDFNSEGHGPVHICDPMFMDKVRENHAQKEVIKDLLEAAKYVIENHNFPSTGDDCYKILKEAIQKAQELQPRGER